MWNWIFFTLLLPLQICYGQPNSAPNVEAPSKKEVELPTPDKIEIKPTARDHEISERLQAILNATGWFSHVQVQVKEGVVFLQGTTKTEEFKKWAGSLARNTQDVSAVVNKIELEQPSIWDFRPIFSGLKELWRDFVFVVPSFVFALFVFFLTWIAARLIHNLSKKLLQVRISSPLLQDLLAKCIAFLIFVIGFYVIFKLMGLTTVALTIIGGTGVLGIVLGIAFRDITENLLASIFLSIHHPFQNGDFVEIEGSEGYVQRLTIRSTVLMTLSGNQVQIPNATVYKSKLVNYSVNPNRQENFLISIGLEEDIPKAQEIALKVLEEHPAILKDPEPMVLVQGVENGAAQIRIYFWLNSKEHSWFKVKSSVIRLVKRAFQDSSIELPGEGRELFFKKELDVHIVEPKKKKAEEKKPPAPEEEHPVVTTAEGGFKSESEELKEQARLARTPGKGEQNLLDPEQK